LKKEHEHLSRPLLAVERIGKAFMFHISMDGGNHLHLKMA
jgi:hypothetical protein